MNFMRRFHKLGEEKRSLVVVPPRHYPDWLYAGAREARVLQPTEAEQFVTTSTPRPPRVLAAERGITG